MNVPDADHPIWEEIVTGRKRPRFEHLAVQMLLGKAQVVLFQDGSERAVRRLAREIHDLFVQNASHPKMQRDLSKVLD
jgi:hypothetical protein